LLERDIAQGYVELGILYIVLIIVENAHTIELLVRMRKHSCASQTPPTPRRDEKHDVMGEDQGSM
jgi:hypothetical protein